MTDSSPGQHQFEVEAAVGKRRLNSGRRQQSVTECQPLLSPVATNSADKNTSVAECDNSNTQSAVPRCNLSKYNPLLVKYCDALPYMILTADGLVTLTVCLAVLVGFYLHNLPESSSTAAAFSNSEGRLPDSWSSATKTGFFSEKLLSSMTLSLWLFRPLITFIIEVYTTSFESRRNVVAEEDINSGNICFADVLCASNNETNQSNSSVSRLRLRRCYLLGLGASALGFLCAGLCLSTLTTTTNNVTPAVSRRRLPLPSTLKSLVASGAGRSEEQLLHQHVVSLDIPDSSSVAAMDQSVSTIFGVTGALAIVVLIFSAILVGTVVCLAEGHLVRKCRNMEIYDVTMRVVIWMVIRSVGMQIANAAFVSFVESALSGQADLQYYFERLPLFSHLKSGAISEHIISLLMRDLKLHHAYFVFKTLVESLAFTLVCGGVMLGLLFIALGVPGSLWQRVSKRDGAFYRGSARNSRDNVLRYGTQAEQHSELGWSRRLTVRIIMWFRSEQTRVAVRNGTDLACTMFNLNPVAEILRRCAAENEHSKLEKGSQRRRHRKRRWLLGPVKGFVSACSWLGMSIYEPSRRTAQCSPAVPNTSLELKFESDYVGDFSQNWKQKGGTLDCVENLSFENVPLTASRESADLLTRSATKDHHNFVVDMSSTSDNDEHHHDITLNTTATKTQKSVNADETFESSPLASIPRKMEMKYSRSTELSKKNCRKESDFEGNSAQKRSTLSHLRFTSLPILNYSCFVPLLFCVMLNVMVLDVEIYVRPVVQYGVLHSGWNPLIYPSLPIAVWAGHLLGMALYIACVFPDKKIRFAYHNQVTILGTVICILSVTQSLSLFHLSVMERRGITGKSNWFFHLAFRLLHAFWTPAVTLLRIVVVSTLQIFCFVPVVVAAVKFCTPGMEASTAATARFFFALSSVIACHTHLRLSYMMQPLLKWLLHQPENAVIDDVFQTKSAQAAATLWPLAATMNTHPPTALPSNLNLLGSETFVEVESFTSQLVSLVFLAFPAVLVGVMKIETQSFWKNLRSFLSVKSLVIASEVVSC